MAAVFDIQMHNAVMPKPNQETMTYTLCQKLLRMAYISGSVHVRCTYTNLYFVEVQPSFVRNDIVGGTKVMQNSLAAE